MPMGRPDRLFRGALCLNPPSPASQAAGRLGSEGAPRRESLRLGLAGRGRRVLAAVVLLGFLAAVWLVPRIQDAGTDLGLIVGEPPSGKGFPAMVTDVSGPSSVCDRAKQLNVLVDAVVYGRHDPDLLRPLKTDVSCGDHGVSMQSSLIGASGLGLRRSDVPVLYLGDTRVGIETAEAWGIEHVVSQSTSGFNQSLADRALWGAWMRGHRFGYVHAARPEGGGSCDSVPLVATARDSRQLRDVWNTPCLELMVHYDSVQESDSVATARLAGMILHLQTVHPQWNYFDARAALRRVALRHPRLEERCPPKAPASFDPEHPDRWNSCQGYGVVDHLAGRDAAAALSLEDLPVQPPCGIRAVPNPEEGWIDLEWYDFAQTRFDRTLVVQFDWAPGYDTPPSAGRILFSGAQGRGWVRVRPDAGSVAHFGFYTVDKDGSVSPLESYARLSVRLENSPDGSLSARNPPAAAAR